MLRVLFRLSIMAPISREPSASVAERTLRSSLSAVSSEMYVRQMRASISTVPDGEVGTSAGMISAGFSLRRMKVDAGRGLV